MEVINIPSFFPSHNLYCDKHQKEKKVKEKDQMSAHKEMLKG